MTFDQDGEARPWPAEKGEISTTATTFTVREGVKRAAGTPLTAKSNGTGPYELTVVGDATTRPTAVRQALVQATDVKSVADVLTGGDGGEALSFTSGEPEVCPPPVVHPPELPTRLRVSRTPTERALMNTELLASAEWQERLDVLATEHHVPGVQVGVLQLDAEGNADIRVLVSGVTSLDTGVTVTEDTLFQYGSISKVWTTTLVMQLVDEGLLTLDTPVVEILPDFRLADPEHAPKVTVRQLVTHTSGIDGDIFLDTGDGDDCVEKYVAALADTHPYTRPDGPLSYCNAGFVLAGRIVEVLRGTTWDEAVAKHIREPLGLTRVITRAKDAPLFRTAVGHQDNPDRDADHQVVPAKVWMLPRSVGPAGLITGTADALLRFGAMHLRDGLGLNGERVLSAESARSMRTRQVDLSSVSTVDQGWGLGWLLTDWDRAGGDPVTASQHGGHTIGQVARLTTFPELGVAICVLTNADRGLGLVDELQALIGADLGLTAPKPVVAEGADIDDLLGVYETVAMRQTLTRDDDGRYFMDLETKVPDITDAPEPRREVTPSGKGRFIVDMEGALTEFTHVVDGEDDYLYMFRLFKRVDRGTAGTPPAIG
ncbi:serine hydrolase [Actinosynnema sp. NPDC023587]|uniref:serine hydrolase domain-containing protein n=1 Tax=Actinosynnema sp. NPDC023587 TaxID=3154695 RepID=UPI0033C6B906